MKRALEILIVLTIFTSVSARNGINHDYRNKWRGYAENSEYPKIVEVVRWRQSVCVLAGPNVPPCFTGLREYQNEYEAMSAEGIIEPDSEHREKEKILKKTRATSLDNIDVKNGVSQILTPRITNFIHVDAFPSDKLLQSSENTNYRDLSVHSNTPEIEHAHVRREGRYLVFSPVKTAAPTVAKTRPEITVTKVLNSPVTATLVANNCFPDIGVPLCNDYHETIPRDPDESASEDFHETRSHDLKNVVEKALVNRPAPPCISSSCSSSSNESVSKAIVPMEIKPRGITHEESHPVEVASSRPKTGLVSAIFDIPKPIFAHFDGDIFDKRNETPILNFNYDPYAVKVNDYDKKPSAEINQGQDVEHRVTGVNGEPVLQSILAGKPAKRPIFFEHFWRTGDIFRKKVLIAATGAQGKYDSDEKNTANHGKIEGIEERTDNRRKYEGSTQRPRYFGGIFKNFTSPCTVDKTIEKMKHHSGFSKFYLSDPHNKRIIVNRPGAKTLLVQKMMNVSEKLAPGGLFGLRSTADGRPLFDINHEINKEYAHVDINPSSGVLSRVFSTIYRPGFIQHSFSIRKQKLSGNEKNQSANVRPENSPARIHRTNDSTSAGNDEKTPCTEPPKIEEITVTIVQTTDGKSKNEEKIQVTKETIDQMIDTSSEIPKISEAENVTKVESTLSPVNDNDEKSKHDENTELTKENVVEVTEKPDEITEEKSIFIDGEASVSNATDGKLMQGEDIKNATEINDEMTDDLNEKFEISKNNDHNDNDKNLEHNTVVTNKTIEKDITKVSEGVDFFEEEMPDYNVTDQLSTNDENTEIATTILEALAEQLDRMSKISEYDDVAAEEIMSASLNDTHQELKDNEGTEKAEKNLGEVSEEKSENPEEIEKEDVDVVEKKLPSVFDITNQESMHDEDSEVATEKIQEITAQPEQTTKVSEYVIVIEEKHSPSISNVSVQTSDHRDNVEVNEETPREMTEGPAEIAKGTENVVADVTEKDLSTAVDQNNQKLNSEEDAEVTTEIIHEVTEGPAEIAKNTEIVVANVTEEVLSSAANNNYEKTDHDEDAEVTTEIIQEITEGPAEIAKNTEIVVANVTEEVLSSAANNNDQKTDHDEDAEVTTEIIQEMTEGPTEIAKNTEIVVADVTEKDLSTAVDKNDQKLNSEEDAEVTTKRIQEITEGPVEIAKNTEIVVANVTEEVLSSAANNNDQKTDHDEDAEVTTEIIQEITEGPAENAKNTEIVVANVTKEVLSSAANNNDQKTNDEDAEVTTEIIQEITEGPAEIAKNTEIVVANVTEEFLSSAANNNDQKTDHDEDAEVTTEIIQEITEGPAEIAKNTEIVVANVTEEVLSSAANNNDQKTDHDEDAEVTTEIIQEITEGPAEIAKNTEIVVANVTEEVLSSAANNNDQKTDHDEDAEVTTEIIQEITEGPAEIAKNTEIVVANVTEEVLSSAANNNDQKTDHDEDAEVTTETIQEITEGPVEIANHTKKIVSGVTEEALSPTVNNNDQKTDHEEDAEVTTQRTEEITTERTNTENVTKDAILGEKSKNTTESKLPEEAETTSTAPEEITTTSASDVKISHQLIVTEATFENFADIELTKDTEQIAIAPKENYSNSVITKLATPVETVTFDP